LGYIRVFVLLSSLVDGHKYRIIKNNVKGKGQKKWIFLKKVLCAPVFTVLNSVLPCFFLNCPLFNP